MNKIFLVGTLTQDASIVDLSNDQQCVNFTLAVEKDMNSARPNPSYFSISSFGKKGFADEAIKGLKKGSAYSVYGKRQNNPKDTAEAYYDNAFVKAPLSAILPAGQGGTGINLAILVGNLTDDAVLFTNGEKSDAIRFRVATNESRRNEAGEWVNYATFHNCVQFVDKGEGEERCKRLTKGREVELEGSLLWPGKGGQKNESTGKVYFNHDVRCDYVLARRKPQGKVEDQAMPAEQQLPQDVIDQQQAGDDIPF